ncbi:MAG TPA: hypothetical protein DDW49_03575 [Deltaproteobacteria bacterium]|nr:MAG: hypothetical protein A2048_09040 [Deltaproteobacteria bacterium GWA2_45_12]HBF12460.1 hypothetical protein [Deltaproteobacteria bacterium]
MKPENKNTFLVTYGLYSAVGIQMVVSVVLGLYAGKWLDSRWNTEPWLMVAGVVLGAVLGFYNLIRLLRLGKEDTDHVE